MLPDADGTHDTEVRWRRATDDDAEALATLIGGVYDEYPGCVLDLPGVDADLRAIDTHLAALGGAMWVLEDPRGLVACVGWAPHDDGAEVKRLYVRADARRRGLGRDLLGHVERVARDRGARRLIAWSDDRFHDAHRLYERLGFVRQSRTRQLHDPSNTTELLFVKELAGG